MSKSVRSPAARARAGARLTASGRVARSGANTVSFKLPSGRNRTIKVGDTVSIQDSAFGRMKIKIDSINTRGFMRGKPTADSPNVGLGRGTGVSFTKTEVQRAARATARR